MNRLKFLRLLSRKAIVLPLVVVACFGLLGFGVYSRAHKAESKNNVASGEKDQPQVPVTGAEDTVLGQAPATIDDPDQRESPGPTTGTKYKLNKDGQMPTVQRRSLIISPGVVTYDGTRQSTAFTATTDDGRLVNMIMKGEGQSLPYWVLSDSTDFTEKSSWTMYIDVSSVTPAQTFTAVVMARTMDEHANEVVYYGSLTVQMPSSQ